MDLHHLSRSSFLIHFTIPTAANSVALRRRYYYRPKPCSHPFDPRPLPLLRNTVLLTNFSKPLGREYCQITFGGVRLICTVVTVHAHFPARSSNAPGVTPPTPGAIFMTEYAAAFCIPPLRFIMHRLALVGHLTRLRVHQGDDQWLLIGWLRTSPEHRAIFLCLSGEPVLPRSL